MSTGRPAAEPLKDTSTLNNVKNAILQEVAGKQFGT
jgi:hypothetical protein